MHRAFAIAATLFALTYSSCYASASHAPGGPYYFKSFASYEQPLRPTKELSAIQAKEHEKNGHALYLAWFGEHGQIIRIEKQLKGSVVFRTEYSYQDGKLIQSVSTDANGKQTIRAH